MKMYQKLLFAVLLTMLASCSSPPASPPLKIAVQSIWPTFSAAFIAQEKELFTKHGVSVTLVPMPGSSGYLDSLEIFKEGKVDAAFMVFADALMLEAEGVATRVVYATDYSDSGDIIVGQPTLQGLSDLKGKKVSFEGFNTFSHLLVLKLLEKVGVHEGEFEVADINPVDVLESLKTGKIQAGHVYGSGAIDTLNQGYKVLAKAGEIPHLMTEVLVINAKVVSTRHEEVKKVVSALVESMSLLKRSPEEGLSIISKHTGIPKTELESTFKGLHVFTLQENQEAFKMGGILHQGGQEIIDFFEQKGVLVKIPDLNQVVDGEFVMAIKQQP
jgi:NitT/TauT family transport system substrate-binding protein